jgi:hypothetical protein
VTEGAEALGDEKTLAAAGLVTMDKVMADVREPKAEGQARGSREGALTALAALVMASAQNAVYLRTSGMLGWLCERLVAGEEGWGGGVALRAMAVLAAAVEEDGRNRTLLAQAGVLPVAARAVVDVERGEDAQDLALRLLQSCVQAEEGAAAVGGSEDLMKALLAAVADSQRPHVKEGVAGLLRDALLTQAGRRTAEKALGGACGAVEVVGKELAALQPTAANKGPREALAGALANLALAEGLRAAFTGAPSDALLHVCRSGKDSAAAWAFALAALMNACLEPSGAVRAHLVQQGAVELCVSLLRADSGLRQKLGQGIWTRSAALLARLSACEAGKGRMEAVKAHVGLGEALCGAVAGDEEKQHLTRALAALTSDASVGQVLTPAVVRAMVAMLPEPRVDPVDMRVTAESVSLVPATRVSDHLAVSITKCLIPVLGGGADRAPLLEAFKDAGGVETLVCLLANAKDGPVRKNVAIVLARAVKGDAAAGQRVRDLRGMEMMVQLGSRLV